MDSVNGLTGVLMNISEGFLRILKCDGNMRLDIIPVDTVVNTLLVAAWDTAAYR